MKAVTLNFEGKFNINNSNKSIMRLKMSGVQKKAYRVEFTVK